MENEYTQIYKNNTGTQIALKGVNEKLGGFLKKKGLPMSPRVLRYQGEDFKKEVGAGFLNRTEVLLKGLVAIGETARARMILEGFRKHVEDQPTILRRHWTTRVFTKIGEIQAILVSGDWAKIERIRFELAEILTMNFAEEF